MAPTIVTSTKNITLRGLSMEIFGINQFGRSTRESWETTTAAYSSQFLLEKLDGIVTAFSTFYSVTASTIVIVPPPQESQETQRPTSVRGLQEQQNDPSLDSVQITYEQMLIFDTTDPTINSNVMVQMPFDTEERRKAYISFLNENSENAALSNVADSTAVTIVSPGVPTSPPETASPTLAPTDGSGGGGGNSNSIFSSLTLPAIIGIGCGGGAIVVLFIIYCLYCRSAGGDSKRSKKGSNSSSTPPMTVSVSRDEVNTRPHNQHSNGYGDQRYV
jgi:hypothetical protein